MMSFRIGSVDLLCECGSLNNLLFTYIQICTQITEDNLSDEVVPVNLNRPMAEILQQLSQYPIRTRLSLTGTLVVARDIAHAKLKERLDSGQVGAELRTKMIVCMMVHYHGGMILTSLLKRKMS